MHLARPTRVSFRAISEPAAEPVTLAEALVHARVDSDEDHALLSGYLIAARQWVEAHIGRPILPTPVAAEIEDWPRDGVLMLDAPIISVTAVTYTDSAGDTAPWTGFVLRNQPGGQKILRPAAGESWPTLGDDPVIRIEAVAGFDGYAPEPIKLAICQLAAHWYAVREPVNIGNVTSTSTIAFTVTELLRPWRWRLIG